ncbi:hypothetical protein [Bailinhaonella thermotolerans]|uniref:Uncharacterized protein n=1 Tax=Bailinhaonella thermotolerans TaxID=1070861 RepID=A0A3A4B3T7_9ACTN|nr:hypothetical protein [Bailinhaonella thermotolerans]RJL35831.1 hypothetical protein D5H75_03355 [Bailinhaonella thermotolerans]
MPRTTTRVAAASALLAGLVAAGGCSAATKSANAGRAETPEVVAPSSPASTASAWVPVDRRRNAHPHPSPTRIAVPPTDPDSRERTVFTAGPARGAFTSPALDLRPGELATHFDCEGRGTVTLILTGQSETEFDCDDDGITHQLDGHTLDAPQTTRLQIKAPPSVQWAIRITQNADS